MGRPVRAATLCAWVHDPSGQPIDYSILIPASSTDTLVAASVEAVDVTSGEPLVGDTLTISNVSFALVDGRWFITFWAHGGTTETTYRLRCSWTLTDGRGSDWTVRLSCLST